MDTLENENEAMPEKGYEPRPTWQVHMARIGLALFLLFVLYQIIQIAGGWQ